MATEKDAKSMGELNPKTTKLEFLGVPGTTAVTIITPVVVYALYFGCSEENGCPPNLSDAPYNVAHALQSRDWWISLWDTQAALVYFGWIFYCYLCWAVMPGDWVDGLVLRDGTRKKYKINALSTLFLTLGITAGWILRFGPESFTFAYDHWVGLVTTSVIFSFVKALVLYLNSFKSGKMLALNGNSGYFIHDFWMGRELNPMLGSLDLKIFADLRPGLIGWQLLNISMACEQATRRGGTLTDSMWLVLIFEFIYVFDAVYNEPAILTTMDTVTDGLGFMLTFGNYSWVPFTFSVQARYLAFHHVELGLPKVAAIVLVNVIGYWIFRSSNNEKNEFRNGSNPKNLTYMNTKRGTKLITSGWWGMSRHPNYMGDLIMALSWSLPTGFDTPVPYFYVVYFTIMLVHRQRRDDEACEMKYGADWEEYKKKVPYRIFPYIY